MHDRQGGQSFVSKVRIKTLGTHGMNPNAILVIGAGGHAKVCIELLRSMGQQVGWAIGSSDGPPCLDVEVLSGDSHIARLHAAGVRRAFIAIGDNRRRLALAEALRPFNFEWATAISPKAIVSPTSTLGCGVAIMAGAVINADAMVGDFAIVNTNASVDHDCIIGTGAHVAPGVSLAGTVHVGELAFLGVGSSVIPNIKIGAGSTVGAGATVVRNVLPNSTVVGTPAREASHSRKRI
jgi:UDP-perosamine 4-acetyltransferase